MRTSLAALAVTSIAACAVSTPLGAQILSDLERERPVAAEDARPLPYKAISGSVDWTYTGRSGGDDDDTGPGFSFRYGAARGLEVGAALRYVTSPGSNALRGISSGDLEVHALYLLGAETARLPALALRVGIQFPTGLDSRGTDLQLSALATRSFDAFRLHGRLGWIRLGDTLATERADRIEGEAAVDFLPSRRGSTDTLLLAAIAVRSSPVVDGDIVLEAEAGLRRRIGIETVFFAGIGSELTGEEDRPRFRLRAGITHVF